MGAILDLVAILMWENGLDQVISYLSGFSQTWEVKRFRKRKVIYALVGEEIFDKMAAILDLVAILDLKKWATEIMWLIISLDFHKHEKWKHT